MASSVGGSLLWHWRPFHQDHVRLSPRGPNDPEAEWETLYSEASRSLLGLYCWTHGVLGGQGLCLIWKAVPYWKDMSWFQGQSIEGANPGKVTLPSRPSCRKPEDWQLVPLFPSRLGGSSFVDRVLPIRKKPDCIRTKHYPSFLKSWCALLFLANKWPLWLLCAD